MDIHILIVAFNHGHPCTPIISTHKIHNTSEWRLLKSWTVHKVFEKGIRLYSPSGLVALWNSACPDISGKEALIHLYSMKEAVPSFTAHAITAASLYAHHQTQKAADTELDWCFFSLHEWQPQYISSSVERVRDSFWLAMKWPQRVEMLPLFAAGKLPHEVSKWHHDVQWNALVSVPSPACSGCWPVCTQKRCANVGSMYYTIIVHAETLHKPWQYE